jgi:hypothetical protein
VFGALVLGAGVTYELAARMTGNTAYRSAVGLALATAFILVWLSLGVGICFGVLPSFGKGFGIGIGITLSHQRPRTAKRVFAGTSAVQNFSMTERNLFVSAVHVILSCVRAAFARYDLNGQPA